MGHYPENSARKLQQGNAAVRGPRPRELASLYGALVSSNLSRAPLSSASPQSLFLK